MFLIQFVGLKYMKIMCMSNLKFKWRERPSAYQETYKEAPENSDKASTATRKSGRVDESIILWVELDERAKFPIPLPGFSQGQKV